MPALGESADEAPSFAVNVALKVGQRLFGAFGLGLSLKEENGQGAKQRQMARRSGFTDGATVLVLGPIPAIVLSIFDAPVVAGQLQQALRIVFLGPIGGHGKADVVGFFGDPALAHLLGMAADAHGLSHPGQAHRLGVSGDAPELALLNASVVFVQRAGLRREVCRGSCSALASAKGWLAFKKRRNSVPLFWVSWRQLALVVCAASAVKHTPAKSILGKWAAKAASSLVSRGTAT